MAIQDSATKQLGAIPFGNIIGGPLVAAVEAQSQAARSTVEFIESVGLTQDENDQQIVQNITFQYSNSTGGNVTLDVPLLTIVPIPYIRIDDMTIQFKANISAETASEDTTTESQTKDINANVTGKYRWGPAKVEASFSAGYSAKKDSSSTANSKYAVEYTMDISLHAVQDDMPAGMQKVLNILNESITSQPQDTTEQEEDTTEQEEETIAPEEETIAPEEETTPGT